MKIEILAPFTTHTSLKILHLRDTHPDTRPDRKALQTQLSWPDIQFGDPPPVTQSPQKDVKAAQCLDFLRWAAGPNGLPGLKVLALGDFSEDYYPKILVRRNELFPAKGLPWYMLEGDTSEQREMLQDLIEKSSYP